MKALILAGGRGKRLKPITDYVPKPLIPINNIPIIEWQIRYLKKFGIKEVIICSGYKTELIENFLKGKDNFGIKIKFSKEKTPLGTGGAIKFASQSVRESDIFVINGDVITNIDLKKLKSQFNSIAAIQLRTKFGVMKTMDNKVIEFSEKKEISDLWMNAGIYYLSRKLIKELPKKGDIEKTAFRKYAKKHQLFHIKFLNTFWHSIDSYKDIEECSNGIKSSKFEKFISK